MFETILYYLDRVSVFWWLCMAVVALAEMIKCRKSYNDKTITVVQFFSRCITAPYLLMILVFTVFIRLQNGFYGYELIPFWSYIEIVKTGNTELIFENILNFLIFIPFGVLVPLGGYKIGGKSLGVKETIAVGFAFSFFIEIIQLITRFGYFEFDDIFHNVLGVSIGMLFYVLSHKILNKRKEKK